MSLRYFLLFIFLFSAPVQAASEGGHWLDGYSEKPELFNEEGYRVTRYRSPTPASSTDAELIGTEDLQRLLASDESVVLLDVLPLDMFEDEFIQIEPRLNIPGSVWLPNVGKGVLDQRYERYFRRNLANLTADNKDRPLVIYCRADCWMSWNAVKRVRSWGYTRLYWYRDGMSGWRESGLPATESEPRPLEEPTG